MKGNGRTTNKMVKVVKDGKMDQFIEGNLKMELSVGMGRFILQMVDNTRENFKMVE